MVLRENHPTMNTLLRGNRTKGILTGLGVTARISEVGQVPASDGASFSTSPERAATHLPVVPLIRIWKRATSAGDDERSPIPRG
jgi:hypothetical protein